MTPAARLARTHRARTLSPAKHAAGVQRVDERRPGLQRILAPTPSDNARTPFVYDRRLSIPPTWPERDNREV